MKKTTTDNKYYTPTEDEFFIGFEIEWLHHTDWIKVHFMSPGMFGFDDVEDLVKQTRVKYLDRDDVESLGWKAGSSGIPMEEYVGWQEFKRHDYTIILFDTGEVRVRQDKAEGIVMVIDTIFKGTIRNKSELQRLLKQLGI